MKIIIKEHFMGPNGFKILLDDGRDITEELHVVSLRLACDANSKVPFTSINIEVGAEVEINVAKGLISEVVTLEQRSEKVA